MSPSLSDLPSRNVIKALESVGFTQVRIKGSHAVYRGTLASILRQAGLTPAEFLELLD